MLYPYSFLDSKGKKHFFYTNLQDELVDFDIKVKEIEEVIERTSEETQQKIDWTQMWAKKYPVLASYKQEVKTGVYTTKLQEMLTDEDAFLVLKDILAQIYNAKKA